MLEKIKKILALKEDDKEHFIFTLDAIVRAA
jgi:hypothetical protein